MTGRVSSVGFSILLWVVIFSSSLWGYVLFFLMWIWKTWCMMFVVCSADFLILFLGIKQEENLDTCLWPAFIAIFTDNVATCLWQSFINVLAHPIGFMVGFNVSSWWCWVMFCFSWCESGRFYGWCCGPTVLTLFLSLGILPRRKVDIYVLPLGISFCCNFHRQHSNQPLTILCRCTWYVF